MSKFLGKDKALWGVARIGASASALYALIATVGGGDPTAVNVDVNTATETLNQTTDLIYKLIDQWPLIVAAVLPLWSKFRDAIVNIIKA